MIIVADATHPMARHASTIGRFFTVTFFDADARSAFERSFWLLLRRYPISFAAVMLVGLDVCAMERCGRSGNYVTANVTHRVLCPTPSPAISIKAVGPVDLDEWLV